MDRYIFLLMDTMAMVVDGVQQGLFLECPLLGVYDCPLFGCLQYDVLYSHDSFVYDDGGPYSCYSYFLAGALDQRLLHLEDTLLPLIMEVRCRR